MTHKINSTIVVKVVDLDTNYIYSRNQIVGMDKLILVNGLSKSKNMD